MYCQKCGAENGTGAKFCKGCGTELSENLSQPSSCEAHEDFSKSNPRKAGKSRKKGCLIVAGAVVLVLVVLVMIALLNGGEASFTTANIQNAVVAKEIDPQTKEATIEQDVFPQDTSVIYVTFYVKNAPSDTKVSAIWVYLPTEESLAGEPVYLEKDAQVQFNVEMPNGFFPGEYQVDLFVDDKLEESLSFLVE